MNAAQGMHACKNCGNVRMPHRVCPTCGEFNGRIYGQKAENKAA
jgi:ribosomal protein L32